MTRGREVAAWLLLTAFGLLMGGAMIEVGVRTLHLLPDRFWTPDPVLGWRPVAGRTGWWTQEDHEFRVPVRINSHGLRDVEHTDVKPDGVTRVLVLGDSFIEALQVPLEQTLGRRLEAALGAGSEVISAGTSSYGTASEFLFLRGEGVRYDPDIVVLAFYPGNDVKNNSATLEDVLPPVYDERGELLRVKQPTVGDGATGRRGWRGSLRAYQYGRELMMRHPELTAPLRRIGLWRAAGPRTAPERDGVPIDYWVFAPQPDAEWTTAWAHTEHLLGQMQETVVAAGRRFAIAVIPPRYQIYPAWWAETVAAHAAMRDRSWDVDAPTRRLLAWCDEHGVPCANLAEGFRAAAAGSATPLYFHHDGHWTAAGHELAARLLAEFLRQRVMSGH